MQHRFRFLANSKHSEKIWCIEGDEFFHLKKVLRLKVGEEVEVFNLEGTWGQGVLVDIEKDHAVVEVSHLEKEIASQPPIALAIGALQQQTMADLIPCLVELGVDELHIFLQEGTAKARLNEKTIARWNKIALSAMKQCKRARLPTIKEWNSLEECLKMASEKFEDLCFLDPLAEHTLSALKVENEKPLCLFLGSEKGFSALELALLQRSKVPSASLGRSILRSFTAAIAAASLLVSKRDSI